MPPAAPRFPSLKDVVVWAMGPKDAVRLFDSKGAIILDFTEVEAHMYEAERKGEGLFFMRTQAAIKAATVTPEQLFGEWTLLQEFEKPLCKLTLSNASAGGESYKITVKPGCDRGDCRMSAFRPGGSKQDELLLTGRGGTWRFSESDATTWERIPAQHRSAGADAAVTLPRDAKYIPIELNQSCRELGVLLGGVRAAASLLVLMPSHRNAF